MMNPSDILNASILIVDDLLANVQLFEEMLHRAGYFNLASTMDPYAVCELHQKNNYDLILLDLLMPGMDGFQVMEGLKKIQPDGYLPVLVITAQPGHKLRALASGAKDFIAKPFDMVEVRTRIHNMLEVRLLYKQLEQSNLVLEQRVAERTWKLEAANKELEAFSYSVSHDLRTPLRTIDGFSLILSEKYHEQLDAQGQDYLKRVRRASQRMGHLIDDLLRLSQVSRGLLKREPVDLSRIVEKVADELRQINPERNVQITVQQGIEVHADPGFMYIVMDNLLDNAYKYTGKKVAAEIEFGVRDSNGERTFYVRDNGVGFNMEYADKLFGAFQRLHEVDAFEGNGIGLATVQRIILRHRGKVWAEAKEGQGATFYFTLPHKEREASEGL